MVAGIVLSAVIGGAAGLAVALTRDHGALQVILSYQFGGGLAVMAFLGASLRAGMGRS